MFQQLSTKLNKALRNLSGKGKLTEKNISDALQDIRDTLIEADAARSVVDQFIARVNTKALGQEVLTSLEPGELLVKIVYDELVELLEAHAGENQINLQTKPPAVILVVGLQGAGKTTTVAKLAHWLTQKQKKSTMVCSTDVYRPAAMEQLKQLANQLDIPSIIGESDGDKPLEITQRALTQAENSNIDVLIIDTAGRSHIDEKMMAEAQAIHQLSNPIETLFVVDGMTGQDAANSAKTFKDTFEENSNKKSTPLTGVILTKMDGDQRGGAALSVCSITKLPIKFIGTSEKVTGFDTFDPERVASVMLDRGDIVAFVNQMQKVDQTKTKKLESKLRKGQMSMNDLLDQLQQLKSLGGPAALLKNLPGANQMMQQEAMLKSGDDTFKKMEALIYSMTPQERENPALLNKPTRKKRVIRGSGTNIQDLNKLLKQHKTMQKMAKKLKGKNMAKMMAAMQDKLGG